MYALSTSKILHLISNATPFSNLSVQHYSQYSSGEKKLYMLSRHTIFALQMTALFVDLPTMSVFDITKKRE